MNRTAKLFEAINQELIDHKLRHVQVRFGRKDHQRYFKFISIDTDDQKVRIKEICDRYCESLAFKSESKTTLTYLV